MHTDFVKSSEPYLPSTRWLKIFMKERFPELMNEWDSEFETIVNRFLDVLGPMGGSLRVHTRAYIGKVHLVEADEDEDFTYGALCAALASLGGQEHEWLLNHEFGNYYSLRHTDAVDLTDYE